MRRFASFQSIYLTAEITAVAGGGGAAIFSRLFNIVSVFSRFAITKFTTYAGLSLFSFSTLDFTHENQENEQ